MEALEIPHPIADRLSSVYFDTQYIEYLGPDYTKKTHKSIFFYRR